MKFSIIFIVSISLFLFVEESYSAGCGHEKYMEHHFKKHPGLKEKMEREQAEMDLIERDEHERRVARKFVGENYTIPVVIHIIYNSASQNPSDTLVKDQIARLNVDYRKLNADQTETLTEFKPFADDMGIQFVLASVDPIGNPTTGINRLQTSKTSFYGPSDPNFDNDCQKSSTGGVDIWDRDLYMNIWVCNLDDSTLGFAQLPGGGPDTDGIVITSSAFGAQGPPPYNLGRTTTHEVGHWFNLRHPWGPSGSNSDCSQDDGVNDTPKSTGPNFQCHLDSTNCGGLNMVQNYMDYSDDTCMTLFTMGQASRARVEVMAGGRRSTNPIAYNGTILGLGNYTFVTPGGSTSSSSSSTSTSSYGSLDIPDTDNLGSASLPFDITHGTPFYVLIACAAFLGLLVIASIFVCIKRSRHRR